MSKYVKITSSCTEVIDLLFKLTLGLLHVCNLSVPETAAGSNLHPKPNSWLVKPNNSCSGRICQLVSQVRDLRLHLLLHLKYPTGGHQMDWR